MPHTSPFFSNTTGYSTENSLIDDLVREQIKIYGMDILYMPRKNVNLDKLLHESSKSAFEFAMPIPMYLKSFSGYQNGMELLSKFGVRSSDEITMVMSRSEFTTYYAPWIQSYYNAIKEQPPQTELDKLAGETAARPKEGDLIYFPFDDGIFEIKYVMFDQPFFQLGQGYVFELQCEKFEYSGETFDTGYEDIDDNMVKPDYHRLEFSMAEGSSSFDQFETVTIYDVSAPVAPLPGATPEEFRLYKDAGYLHGVPEVKGKVMEWNAATRKLLVGDVTDMDPTQMDRLTGDLTINKFDTVMIVGDNTEAVWYSESVTEMDIAFNDSKNNSK